AVNFVGCDGGSGAGTAHHDAAFGATFDDGMPDSGGKIGIIHRCSVAGAQVDEFVSCIIDPLFDRFFQMKTGMIAANCNNHFTKSLKVLLCSSSEIWLASSGISR